MIVVEVVGFDVVVGGYSYMLLGDMEGVEGFYLIMVKGFDGVEVFVVIVYVYSKYFGYFVLIWDDVGNLIKVEGLLILLDVLVMLDVCIVVCVKEMVVLIEELK